VFAHPRLSQIDRFRADDMVGLLINTLPIECALIQI